jgi:hypothetical protein
MKTFTNEGLAWFLRVKMRFVNACNNHYTTLQGVCQGFVNACKKWCGVIHWYVEGV